MLQHVMGILLMRTLTAQNIKNGREEGFTKLMWCVCSINKYNV